jgi:hypothetical protein
LIYETSHVAVEISPPGAAGEAGATGKSFLLLFFKKEDLSVLKLAFCASHAPLGARK